MATKTKIGEWTIEKDYYIDFFERLYKLQNEIKYIPRKLRAYFDNQYFHRNFRAIAFYGEELKFNEKVIRSYLRHYISAFVNNIMLFLAPKFDVNRFLNIFDLVKPDKGYVLDYKYRNDHPSVYSRRDTLIRRLFNSDKTFVGADLYEIKDIGNISFEKTPKGYFQFAVFSNVINDFYLFESVINSVYIYSKKQIQDILKDVLKEKIEDSLYEKWEKYEDPSLSRDEISESAKKEIEVLFENKTSEDDYAIYLGPLFDIRHYNEETKEISIIKEHWTTRDKLESLLNSNVDPQVTLIEDGYAIVKIMSFTKHGGFQYIYSHIRYQNIMEKEEVETVLEYHCHETE